MNQANFVDDVRKAVDGLKIIEEVKGLLDVETLSMLRSLRAIDMHELKQAIDAADIITDKLALLETVSDGMNDIENIVDIQNQVGSVSEMRKTIEFVAEKINIIDWLAVYYNDYKSVLGMKSDIENILLIKDDIKDALLMAEDIDTVSRIASQLRDDINTFEKKSNQIQKDLKQASTLMNAAGQAERRINETLEQMEAIEKRMQQFSVSVVHVGPETKASSQYNPTKNQLLLTIPSGEKGEIGDRGEKGERGSRGIPGTAVEKGDKGDRGDPGIDGKNFAVSRMGNKRDMKKYKNMPIGFSFLSLDENPSMIYFRKSNTTDDWTDGQPFGLTDGEEAKITVSDSERIGGYTIDQLMLAIQTNVEKILYIKDKHGSSS